MLRHTRMASRARLSSLLAFLCLALLSFVTTSSTLLLQPASALALTDAYGFPLFYVVPPANTSDPYSETPTPTSGFSYSPAAFGASIASTASVSGVLGLSAELLTPQSGNANGCAALQAPAGYVPSQPTNVTAQGYFTNQVVLVKRDSSCTDQARSLNAEAAGASLVLLVGCPSMLPGGPTGSGTVSGHCGWMPLNSTNSSVGARVNIPVLLISTSNAAKLQSALLAAASSSSSDAPTVFFPGSGAILESDWNVLRDLAASMTVSSSPDPLASGTRPFSDLLATQESSYSVASTTPGGAPTVYTLTQVNINYGLDPCFSRVRGVWCISGRVVILNLNGVGITPAPTVSNPRTTNFLPASLTDLSALTMLSLASNLLRGSLPSGLLNTMPSLVSLDLSNQGLSGELQPGKVNGQVGESKLQYLNLQTNALSSTQLSSSLVASLVGLKAFNIMSNQITGVLPGEIALWRNIEVMQLDYNALTGPLSDSIFSALTELRVFTIEFCSFSGPLPASFGAFQHVTTLSLGHNAFSGSFPPEWFGSGRLSTLEVFSVSTNSLSGPLPAGISSWRSLTTARFSANRLAGEVPQGLGALTKLSLLHLHTNSFTSVPASLRNLTSLKAFWMNDNQLSGNIFDLNGPTALNPRVHWPMMQVLRLSNNRLTGPMPSVSGLQSLTELTCDSNRFTSPVDLPGDWFDNLPRLVTLSFASNQLSFRSFPDFTGGTSLQVMDFSHNLVASSGVSPLWILPQLTTMRLNDNAMKGDGSMGRLASGCPKLREINLSHNALSLSLGMYDIGSFLAQLPTSIERVFLSYNALAGPLTTYLDRLGYGNLTQLVMDHNSITTVAPHIFYNAIPNATVLDFSYNKIESNQVLGQTQPVFSLSTIKLEGNPHLVSSLSPSPLPSWLSPSHTYTKSVLSQRYSCPILTGTTRPMSVTLDPEFYEYELCVCDRGTYGVPPSCELIPSLVDYTSPDASLSLSADASLAVSDSDGAYIVSSITDGTYGDARFTPGMDILWVLGAPAVNVSLPEELVKINGTIFEEETRPVRAVYIDLEIDTTQFNKLHDTLFVYAGGSDRATAPLYEFYGTTFQRQADLNGTAAMSNVSSTSLTPSSSSSFFTQRLTIPSSRATLNFRSQSLLGRHFTARWSVGYECPGGWEMVEERYLEGLDARRGGVMMPEDLSQGTCLPVYKPSSAIQVLIYSASGFVMTLNLITIVLLLVFRDQRIIKSSNLPLCIQILIWNMILSASALLFAFSPNPHGRIGDGGMSMESGWGCRVRPWPVALGIMGVMSALLTKAITIMRIFSSTKLTVLAGLTPEKMFGTSMAMLSVEIILLIVYSTLPLSSLELIAGSGSHSGQFIFQCSSLSSLADSSSGRSYAAWLIVEFLMMTVFIGASLWVAWKNRNLPAAYNESQHTSHAMALLCFLALVTIALNFIVEDNPDQVMAIRGLGLNLGSLMLLMVLFAPKLYLIATGLGNELIMTQLTKSQVDAQVAQQVAEAGGHSSGSDGGNSGSGGGGSGGGNSGGSNGTYSSRPSRIGSPSSPSGMGMLGQTPRLSVNFLAKAGVPITATAGKSPTKGGGYQHEPSTSRLDRARSLFSSSSNVPRFEHEPSVSRVNNRPSTSISCVRSPSRMGSQVGPSRPAGTVSSPPRKMVAPVLARSEEDEEDVTIIKRKSSGVEGIHPDVFQQWKSQYDAEIIAHFSSELTRISSEYQSTLAMQSNQLTQATSRLSQSRSALLVFDTWLGGLLSRVPDASGEMAEQKRLFDKMRPKKKLLEEVTPLLQEDGGGGAEGKAMKMDGSAFVSKLALPTAASGASSTAPSSPAASITLSSSGTPSSSIQPGQSSSTPSLSLTPGASSSASPSSPGALVENMTPEQRQLTKSTVFSAVRKKAGFGVTLASEDDAVEMEELKSSGDDLAPMVSRPKKNTHRRDLSSSIPQNVAAKLGVSTGAVTGSLVKSPKPTSNLSLPPVGAAPMRTASPLPSPPIRTGMFASGFSISASPSPSPSSSSPSDAKGHHRRRKTLAEKGLNGRGEKGVFLKDDEEEEDGVGTDGTMTDGTATDGAATDGTNTADEAEVDPRQMQIEVDEKMPEPVTREKSSSVNDPFRGMHMSTNPLLSTPDSLKKPSKREMQARRASLDRVALLRMKLGNDSASAVPTSPLKVNVRLSSDSGFVLPPSPAMSRSRMVDDSDDESDAVEASQVSAISRSAAPITAIHHPSQPSPKHQRQNATPASISVVLEAVEPANAASVAFAGAATKALTPVPSAELSPSPSPPPSHENADPVSRLNTRRKSLLLMALDISHAAAVRSPKPHIPIHSARLSLVSAVSSLPSQLHQHHRSLDSAVIHETDPADALALEDQGLLTRVNTATATNEAEEGHHLQTASGMNSRESSYLGSRHHSRLRMPGDEDGGHSCTDEEENPLDRLEEQEEHDFKFVDAAPEVKLEVAPVVEQAQVKEAEEVKTPLKPAPVSPAPSQFVAPLIVSPSSASSTSSPRATTTASETPRKRVQIHAMKRNPARPPVVAAPPPVVVTVVPLSVRDQLDSPDATEDGDDAGMVWTENKLFRSHHSVT